MKAEPATPGERPLSGLSRLALFCAAGATILLSYVVSTVSVLALLVLVGFEFLLVLGLARFGLARLMAGVMGAHIALLGVLCRSFWLRKGVEYRIQLREAEAPMLFETVSALCRKAQVEMPREISVEMSANAWVRLKGYRRGAGRTVLGIGYDLLAGLSRWEMEGVLAHEITHAKLVRRGYKSWMNRGMARMGQLARGLHAHVSARRSANLSTEPGQMLFRLSDQLARSAARLVAGCSRQDEFDADRGAAALCGPGAIRSSLIKLEAIQERAADLPWAERVARLQAGQGFSHWLVEELSRPADNRNDGRALFFQYSTHPSLVDRLAALSCDTEPPPESKPAIGLLKDPDNIAESLISEIQKVAAEQEQKDSKRLRRWSRKGAFRARLRPLQSLGVLLVLIGGIAALGSLGVGFDLRVGMLVTGIIAAGVFCFRYGRYRERLPLAVPGFAMLKAAWENPASVSDDAVKAIEAELRSRVENLSSKSRRAFELASLSYQALGRCDYVRAHVAARLGLAMDSQSIEAVAGLAVAAGALGQVQQVHQALNFLQRKTGFAAPSILWAAGWALMLCGDWSPAEAFLERSCRLNPGERTLQLALALCQSKRGKLQSALSLARQVCTPRPVHIEHAKFLIKLLLRAGYLREAQQQLRWLEAGLNEDVELILIMVQVSLLVGNLAAAATWTDVLKQKKVGAHLFIRLGSLYETARQSEKAAGFYQEALTSGFYPEGLLGLARIKAKAQNRDEARTHLLNALNIERRLGDKAVGPLPLFNHILGELVMLENPEPGCRAWIAKLNRGKSPSGLEHRSVLVYASSYKHAEQLVCMLFGAMQPSAALSPANISWIEARKELQPDGPVRAGVQCVLE